MPATADDRALILAEERCRIELADQTVVVDGRIVFRPHRFPSAVVELADLAISLTEDARVSVVLESSGFELPDGILEADSSSVVLPRGRFLDRVRQGDPMSLQRSSHASAVECVVYNLGRFGFRGGPSDGSEHLDLDIPNGWRATIGPLAAELRRREVRELLGTPWRRPTHTLRLLRSDSGDAPLSEIRDTLFLLRYFLSFAWGRKIGMALAQGFSSTGELVYAEPGMTRVDARPDSVARQRSRHWFPPSQAEILGEILPGFWNRMTDPEWKDCVDWALYWWLSVNHFDQASETSVLASQAGLEAVAPVVLKHYERISKREAKSGRKGEGIERMLRSLQVPLAIPGELGELRAMAAAKSWIGPEALVEVRNALAHPDKGNKAGLAYEASQLGMWYLELVLLFLFGYRGKIVNRTVFGGPWLLQETVPWAHS